MFIHYRTEAIILKKEERAEADQIFTIFTRDFGKIEILGRGIRKIKSKLRAGMEQFSLSEIEFIQGKIYKTLTDAVLIDNFPKIKKDLKKLAIAFRISEVFGKLVKGEEPDIKIWNLLVEVFNKLNDWESEIIYYYFLWNFLSILGYQPELYNCCICQKLIKPAGIARQSVAGGEENVYFSAEEGGLICGRCKKISKPFKKIDFETIKLLRLFLKKDWYILKRLNIKTIKLDLLRLISDYFLFSIIQIDENKLRPR